MFPLETFVVLSYLQWGLNNFDLIAPIEKYPHIFILKCIYGHNWHKLYIPAVESGACNKELCHHW